ncbi:glycosyltransferase family 2 protein [Roseivivax sediminis]|uniref:Glycosyl transferase family 2 n=1 Tax=Roseivivax sediminis TaxID=936889 RepID=A0A1I1WKG1_9RHOB|nr:glycosyltransferase family 2 protein [Roseivivax sediminis]SFD93903.1 Glycosyl transferase family 2 [Roseivivax sediminis]
MSLSRLRGRASRALQYAAVRRSIRHVAGPRRFELSDTEVATILVGRNVGFFLDRFAEHHRALGADYLVFLDNGSSDDGPERAARMDNTIVATTDANFAQNEAPLRYYAATLFTRGGWRLCVDADERLDYVGADRLALPDLAARLTARGHTGLAAQMLEMAPPGPIRPDHDRDFDAALSDFTRCSLADITSHPYHDPALPFAWFLAQNSAGPEVEIKFGGLRRTLFGEECCLTKHPFFRAGPGIVPQPHPHVTTGIAVADFTALLRHYKFAGGALARDAMLTAEGRVAHTESAQRLARFSSEPALSFDVTTAQDDPGVEGLTEAGFLTASPEARAMLGA